jgi:pyruvate dehydrogenase E2 component (dihydrolipoamide acetyltransferase)
MARVEVPMPQMGESIAEGTVSVWLKKVGDRVERDEPIMEISTDKVDAEIPSPVAGVLAEVVVSEGQTPAWRWAFPRAPGCGPRTRRPAWTGPRVRRPRRRRPRSR